jgi:hypothetical protein
VYPFNPIEGQQWSGRLVKNLSGRYRVTLLLRLNWCSRFANYWGG